MDARHLSEVEIDQTTLVAIERRRWVEAPQSRAANGLLATGWLLFLWSIGLFSAGSGEAAVAPLSSTEQVIMTFVLATIVGVFGTLGAALANNRLASRLSAGCALAMVVLGATCGFAGHTISSWGPSTGIAAVLGLASLAVLGRGATATQ